MTDKQAACTLDGTGIAEALVRQSLYPRLGGGRSAAAQQAADDAVATIRATQALRDDGRARRVGASTSRQETRQEMTEMPYLALLTLLGGCAVQTETVYLRSQETGQSAQCGPYNAYETSATMESARDLRHCVAGYQSQGFVTVPQP